MPRLPRDPNESVDVTDLEDVGTYLKSGRVLPESLIECFSDARIDFLRFWFGRFLFLLHPFPLGVGEDHELSERQESGREQCRCVQRERATNQIGLAGEIVFRL